MLGLKSWPCEGRWWWTEGESECGREKAVHKKRDKKRRERQLGHSHSSRDRNDESRRWSLRKREEGEDV